MRIITILIFFRPDGTIWFRPPLEKFPCDIGVKDIGDSRGVKVYFSTPSTGMQHVFITAETFTEQYDFESGNTIGFTINDPMELYTKVAAKFRKETQDLQRQALQGLPTPGSIMKKQLVR